MDSEHYVSDQSVKAVKCIKPNQPGHSSNFAEDEASEKRPSIRANALDLTRRGPQLVHFRGSIVARVSESQLAPPTHTINTSISPATGNCDENRNSTRAELHKLFCDERAVKSDVPRCALTPPSGGGGRRTRQPHRRLPAREREPFNAVCPSRSLQCFLRSKQRRCLHYRKAVLGEEITCLPHDDTKKWSSDLSIVHSN